MEEALLAGRLLLAAIFVVAGVAKLADLSGSRQGLLGFGVPEPLARPLGGLLPIAELGIGLMLVPAATAWWASVGALALLLTFVVAIGVSLARGQAPDCHCFGQIHSAPVGWSTLARNGLLAAIAGVSVWYGLDHTDPAASGVIGHASLGQWLALGGGAVVAGLLAFEAWLLLGLMRQNGRLLLRVEALESSLAETEHAPRPTGAQSASGLPVGAPAPDFRLPGLHGETLTLETLRAHGKPVLLVFSDPGCGPCNALMPEIGRWQREHANDMTVGVISRGTPEVNRAKSSEHGLAWTLVQRDREVAEVYGAHGTPSAVVVRPDGTIGSPLAQGAEQIRGLVARTLGRLPKSSLPSVVATGNGHQPSPATVPARASRIGQVAPDFALPDLDGATVRLADLRGHDTLLLFWNPNCGFCQRMLPDLRAWEETAPPGSPRLLVVSTGPAEANRSQGLRSTIVLDDGFATGRTFGARGTPSAVLVDGAGVIVSDVAVGVEAVLGLAARRVAALG